MQLNDVTNSAYYVTILDAVGRTILMLPKPELQNGIDISHFAKGKYIIQLMEEKTKQTSSKIFLIN